MQSVLTTFNIVLPVFAIMTLGGILRRRQLINHIFVQQTNRLLYYVFLPFLLFYKIGTADFQHTFNLRLTLGMVITYTVGAVLSYLIAIGLGYSLRDRGSFCQGAFRGNLAYVGLPIVLSAYGDPGFTRAGILLGCLVPFVNLYAILALVLPSRPRDSTRTWDLVRTQLALNPLIIGAAAGILWSLTSLPLPGFAERALHTVTGATLPLALLVIGASFSLRQMQGDLHRAGLACLLKLAAFPALAWVILSLMQIQGVDLGIGILLSATPTAAASFVMAEQLGGNSRLAGSIIVLTTLLSSVSFSVLLMLLSLAQLLPD